MKISKLENVVPIVADGAIANPVFAEGRMIPVLIVDCSEHQALVDLALVHQDTPPGDVRTRWAWVVFDKRHVYLEVSFIKPVQTTATIQFDVRKQGVLVYGILVAHGFYLQPSNFGKTASEGFGKPNVIVEVPAGVTPPNWDAVCESQLAKRFKKQGFSRTQARQAALEHIARAKEMWNIGVQPPAPVKKVS